MKRRRPHNQLGFALQLCALRFPGRLLRPGELVSIEMARFVADQLDIDPGSLADYATRAATRYDQLETLREIFGFRSFSQPDRRELSAWLLPIALTTVNGMVIANALMVELRRRGIAAPGVTVIERMTATALLRAERQVSDMLSRDLTEIQRAALDALLEVRPRSSLSNLLGASTGRRTRAQVARPPDRATEAPSKHRGRWRAHRSRSPAAHQATGTGGNASDRAAPRNAVSRTPTGDSCGHRHRDLGPADGRNDQRVRPPVPPCRTARSDES